MRVGGRAHLVRLCLCVCVWEEAGRLRCQPEAAKFVCVYIGVCVFMKCGLRTSQRAAVRHEVGQSDSQQKTSVAADTTTTVHNTRRRPSTNSSPCLTTHQGVVSHMDSTTLVRVFVCVCKCVFVCLRACLCYVPLVHLGPLQRTIDADTPFKCNIIRSLTAESPGFAPLQP